MAQSVVYIWVPFIVIFSSDFFEMAFFEHEPLRILFELSSLCRKFASNWFAAGQLGTHGAEAPCVKVSRFDGIENPIFFVFRPIFPSFVRARSSQTDSQKICGPSARNFSSCAVVAPSSKTVRKRSETLRNGPKMLRKLPRFAIN